MDIESYRNIIKLLLTAYAAVPIANGAINSYAVFDTEQDHYLVMDVGWDGQRRAYSCALHLDIKEGKFGLRKIRRK